MGNTLNIKFLLNNNSKESNINNKMSNSQISLLNFDSMMKAGESEAILMDDSKESNINNKMSNSQISLLNLDSMMKTGESEAILMDDSKESNVAQIIESENSIEEVTSLANLPKFIRSNDHSELPSLPIDEVKTALNNTNISAVLNRISNNPEELNKVMETSINSMTPEMMEQARKLAMGGQGQQIIREMQRKGIDPKVMRSHILEEQKILKGLSSKVTEMTKKAILITNSRQLKVRNIPISSIKIAAANLVKSSDPVELSCSRLAAGPLKGKTIKVWCNPQHPGKNKRASKIIGFPMGGEMLIIMEEGDLNEKDFLAAEKLLI